MKEASQKQKLFLYIAMGLISIALTIIDVQYLRYLLEQATTIEEIEMVRTTYAVYISFVCSCVIALIAVNKINIPLFLRVKCLE